MAYIITHQQLLQSKYTHTMQTVNRNFTSAHIQIVKWVLIIISYDRNANNSVLLFHNTPYSVSKMKTNVSNKEEQNSQMLQMGVKADTNAAEGSSTS